MKLKRKMVHHTSPKKKLNIILKKSIRGKIDERIISEDKFHTKITLPALHPRSIGILKPFLFKKY